MSRDLTSRERGIWIGTVAVLATSLSWMALLQFAWIAHQLAPRFAGLRAVARAVGHIVWSGLGWAPMVLIAAASLVALVVLIRALLDGARPHREIRHV